MRIPFLPDLAQRSLQHELMDDPALDPAEHERALAGLRLLNRASRTVPILWKRLCALMPRTGGTPLRILDIATGSGDIPLALERRARRAGVAMHVDGCDISARAVALARAR